MKLYVIVTVFNRYEPLAILIRLFKIQSNPNWQMIVAHDGPAIQEVRDVVAQHSDLRISLYEHPKTLGKWGFLLRRYMLEQLQADPNDFVLFTNDDNIYIPKYVEYMLKECVADVGMVYCDTIHSHLNYATLFAQLKVNFVDMGSFITKIGIAKEVGFRHDVFESDGLFAEECAMRCAEKGLRAVYINKSLFIHC
ncbi:MAG: glycosyltransferase family A protein [Candidatus Omnitrophica bacterium]|nr:glycosyltransferase family A protein [Candidatus Omnitrophota bacterium]